jgi:hypothetical protein
VPDGNTAGWTSRQTLSGIPNLTTLDVTVTLTLSGGYNGDLYAYLTHGDGFVVLLNRVGLTAGQPYGYADAGFTSLTLSDAGSGNIHRPQ